MARSDDCCFKRWLGFHDLESVSTPSSQRCSHFTYMIQTMTLHAATSSNTRYISAVPAKSRSPHHSIEEQRCSIVSKHRSGAGLEFAPHHVIGCRVFGVASRWRTGSLESVCPSLSRTEIQSAGEKRLSSTSRSPRSSRDTFRMRFWTSSRITNSSRTSSIVTRPAMSAAEIANSALKRASTFVVGSWHRRGDAWALPSDAVIAATSTGSIRWLSRTLRAASMIR